MYYLNTQIVIGNVYHTSINIADRNYEKFKKYEKKHPVNLSDTVNRALELFLEQKLKEK